MWNHLALRFLAAAACVALAGGPSTVLAQAATLIGQPTYSVVTDLDIDRGTTPPISHVARINRSNGNGHGSGGTVVTGPVIVSTGPTEALGTASDTELKSRSQATGSLQRAAPAAFVKARSRAEITRYFEWQSNTLTSVPVDFTVLMDGTLINTQIGELLTRSEARIDFGLEIIDLNNQVLQRVLSVSAGILRTFNGAFVPYRSSGGAVVAQDWIDSITDVGVPPGFFFGKQLDVTYIDLLPAAYSAPVGVVQGYRWYLETSAEVTGDFINNNLVTADFANTATVGFDLNAAAAGQATVTEYLSVAPVPLPPAAGLLAAAIGCLGACRRFGKNRPTA